MSPHHDPNVRRLRAMQREVAFILLVNIACIAFPDHVLQLVGNCANALLWGLMLMELQRDLALSRSPLSPPKQGDRMKHG